MPEERHERHLIGPILLILAGVGLLLEQMGILTIAWGSLWQYWPVLLILLGLDILLGRSRWGGLLLVALTVGIVLAIALAGPSGWATNTAALEQETLTYPLASIEQAEVRLKVGVAHVEVGALPRGSSNLAEVLIEQGKNRSSYTADLSQAGDEAELRIENTRATWGPLPGEAPDRWTIAINPEVALSLYVDGGVSRAEYDLSALDLQHVDINVGVGDVTVALPSAGEYRANIEGGIGRVTVNIPAGAAARIYVDGGIGSTNIAPRFSKQGNVYVTENWSPNEPAIEVDINGGIGSLHVR